VNRFSVRPTILLGLTGMLLIFLQAQPIGLHQFYELFAHGLLIRILPAPAPQGETARE
jgi:hypothetical protein